MAGGSTQCGTFPGGMRRRGYDSGDGNRAGAARCILLSMKVSWLRRSYFTTVLALLSVPANATWSIVAVNMRTGEVGVASATCLEDFNLRRYTPVVYVGRGAASAQGYVDSFGTNRPVIRNALRDAVLTPDEILVALQENDPSHESRVYNIVSFTGTPGMFIGHVFTEGLGMVSGTVGDYVYAVVGSGLTGEAVVTASAEAFRNTNGDMGQRFMAGLQAGRALGGDGRCSCSFNDPTSCGVPPPDFEKSAHCGYVIVARHGDQNGACTSNGCASGNYHLTLNIAGANAQASSPDPVEQLQMRYDLWRSARAGRPDAILSEIDPVIPLPADGFTKRRVTVRLRDIDGAPLTSGGADVRVGRLDDDRSLVGIGPVIDQGDGTYSFSVRAGRAVGTETLVVTAEDDLVKATLYPYLEVQLEPSLLAKAENGSHALLTADATSVSAAAGADVPFVVSAPHAAGSPYFLLGGLSGTQPGMRLGSLRIPLNPDAMTSSLLRLEGRSSWIRSGMGVLDERGRAEGAFLIAPDRNLALVGQRMDWTAVIAGPWGPEASPALGLEIRP